jgi:hypothetical protein
VVLLHEHDDVGDRGCITSACPIQPGSEFSGPRAPANVPAVEFTSPVLHGRPQLSASPAPALWESGANRGRRARRLVMTKSRHTSLASLAIYAKPTFDAVAAATAALDPDRRR